jgi:16S rRNA (guanine527-N7)-methyltransferase
VLEVLALARTSGFLGPGPVEDHVRHALGFAEVAGSRPALCVDLGSGGGVPGLVLAGLWPEVRLVLVDSSARRTAFLEGAVRQLGAQDRVEVVRAAAEEVGRDPGLRGRADLVVARSFAAPPVTAECAAPLLRVDGVLVVSEPPEQNSERWPTFQLGTLGLGAPEFKAVASGSFVRMRLEQTTPDVYPRRAGVPAKRPLF